MDLLTVNRVKDRISVSFPASINSNYVEQLIEFLKVKTIASQSQATDDQIVKLANDLNKDWWTNNKHKFIK